MLRIEFAKEDHDCPSCKLKTGTRDVQALGVTAALRRERIRSLEEYIKFRERDESHEG